MLFKLNKKAYWSTVSLNPPRDACNVITTLGQSECGLHIKFSPVETKFEFGFDLSKVNTFTFDLRSALIDKISFETAYIVGTLPYKLYERIDTYRDWLFIYSYNGED